MATAQPTPSTRERLIEAAIALFWEKGYANTSMTDLLAAARANSGSFYHFFDSKEDLLLAMLDRYQAMLHPGAAGACLEWRERSHRAHLRAPGPLPRVDLADRLHLRMPHREARSGNRPRAARGSSAARAEL